MISIKLINGSIWWDVEEQQLKQHHSTEISPGAQKHRINLLMLMIL